SFSSVATFFKLFYIYYHKDNRIGQLYGYLQSLVGNIKGDKGVTFSLPTKAHLRQKYVPVKIFKKNLRTNIFTDLVKSYKDAKINIKVPQSINIIFQILVLLIIENNVQLFLLILYIAWIAVFYCLC